MEEEQKNLPFYANSRVTYNLRSRKNYSKFITHHLRRIERTQHVTDDDDDDLLPDSALVNLDLKLNDSRVRLKLVSSRFYIAGFEIGYHNNRLWEIRDEGDTVTLRGSNPIGFRVNYPQEQGSICNRQISFESLTNAVSSLIHSQHPNQDPALRDDIMLIDIMLIESARFQWIFETCNKCVQKHMSVPIDPWVENLVTLSRKAKRCTQDPVILSEDEQEMVDKRDALKLFEKKDESAKRSAKDLVRVLHLV